MNSEPLSGQCAVAPSAGDSCRSFPDDPFCKLTVGCFWTPTFFHLSRNILLVVSPNPFLSKRPVPLSPGAHLHAHPSDLLGHRDRVPPNHGKEPSLFTNSPWRTPLSLVKPSCTHSWGTITHLELWTPRRTGLSIGLEPPSLRL